ncbi:MAG: carboxypeptidase regulatory-like domain-containing protein [Anaerolineae bacterium]
MKTVKLSLVVTGVMICLALVTVIMVTPASSEAREISGVYARDDQGIAGSSAKAPASENDTRYLLGPIAFALQGTPLPPPPRPPTPEPSAGADSSGATGSLVGQVWDLFTDGPAANVTVRVNDIEVVTDDQGRYAINELPVGAYEVVVQLPASGVAEYSSSTITVKEGEIYTLDLSFYSQPLPTPTPVPPPPAAPASSGSGRPSSEFVPGSSSPLTVYTGGPPMIWVNPEFVNQEMGIGGSITIDVGDMSDFGGFQGELLFDPAVVEIQSVELGDFLESTGRTAGPLLAEVDDSAGSLFFGAYSSGRVAGPNGGGTLIIVNFTAKIEGSSAFDLENVVLTSRLGDEIAANVFDGSLRASACFGDLNGDKVVDINDIQAVAGRVGQSRGGPNYDEIYDFNFNGEIDDEDVEVVFARWNQTCQ